MAIGGFRGTDPAPTLAEFERLVAEHKIHYFVAGGGGFGRDGGFAGGGSFAGGTGRGFGGGQTAGARASGGQAGGNGAPGNPAGGAGGAGGHTDAVQITAWVLAHYRPTMVGGEPGYVL